MALLWLILAHLGSSWLFFFRLFLSTSLGRSSIAHLSHIYRSFAGLLPDGLRLVALCSLTGPAGVPSAGFRCLLAAGCSSCEATPPRAANCWRSAAVQTALDVEEAGLVASDQFSAGAASIRRAPRRLALRTEILAASAAGGSPVPLDTATASAVSRASSMTKPASNPRGGHASLRGRDAGRFSDELSTDCPAGSIRL
jgi:hypothetical protein